jgi:hypothetical protein
MARKPVYLVEGRRWMPEARARQLIGTSPAGMKRLMGDGSLEWIQNPRGLALLVLEADVLRLREERGIAMKETGLRGAAALKTAQQRKASMRAVAAPGERLYPLRGPGVFDRTWDPSPQPLPISGRAPDEPDKR